MPAGPLTGTRIRERRVDLGMRQADLARSCDISPSYLNLIEHNRRSIGGKLLSEIAQRLETDVALLSEGAGGVLTDALSAAAAARPESEAEREKVAEFAGRYPGWARLILAQDRRIAQLDRQVEMLGDRLNQDPALSNAMHDILSAATAIRSVSGILAEGETIEPDWQARFHRNLYEDSQRLAVAASALQGHLDADEGEQAEAMSPQEEVEAWLDAEGWHIPVLERALPKTPDTLVGSIAQLTTDGGRARALDWIVRYTEDARRMPRAQMKDALAQTSDPSVLAARFGVDLATALRRLACLPSEIAPESGLILADGAGALTLRKAVPGFEMPRFGAACPLWPVFAALGRPMAPVRALISMPAEPERRFEAFAIATPSFPTGFDGPAVTEATMLLRPVRLDPDKTALRVGGTCRVCPREGCPARRDPSLLSDLP